MYTLIILTRLNGFSLHSFPHTQSGFEEARQVATKACRESETEALIYGPEGFIIWRAGGRQSPISSPVASDPVTLLRYEIRSPFQKVVKIPYLSLKSAIIAANKMHEVHNEHFIVVQVYKEASQTIETIQYATGYRACVNDAGSYYSSDGTFMNADGTRNIFDDVDA